MFKIGFNGSAEEHRQAPEEAHSICPAVTPRKSVVRVHFPARNMNLSYYNDAFDLKRGDIVFVEGKLESLRGRVVDVAYNFKIKLSDYKRVISVADTNVQGEFSSPGRTSSRSTAALFLTKRSSPGLRHPPRRMRCLFPAMMKAASCCVIWAP